MKSTEKVSRDVAKKDIVRFADAMSLDLDTANMDKDSKEGLEKQTAVLEQAIMRGNLVINAEGEPVYTPFRTKDAASITFYEPRGDSLLAMDKRKKDEDISKTFASMAAITRCDASTFSAMKMADLKVCLAVLALFLG